MLAAWSLVGCAANRRAAQGAAGTGQANTGGGGEASHALLPTAARGVHRTHL